MSDIDVKIKHEKPAIYDELHDKFGVEWDNGLIITFYPFVYCKDHPTAEKILHESVHLRQQVQITPEFWWKNFLLDPQFRLHQELEAYQREADFIKKNIKNRNDRAYFIHRMAQNLSSSIYGKIISYSEALKLLM